MAEPENPFAFPVSWIKYPQTGMTLRDYFAGQALIGLIGRRWDEKRGDIETIQQWAESSFITADAMLKARQS